MDRKRKDTEEQSKQAASTRDEPHLVGVSEDQPKAVTPSPKKKLRFEYAEPHLVGVSEDQPKAV
jgi:hypothetical protein